MAPEGRWGSPGAIERRQRHRAHSCCPPWPEPACGKPPGQRNRLRPPPEGHGAMRGTLPGSHPPRLRAGAVQRCQQLPLRAGPWGSSPGASSPPPRSPRLCRGAAPLSAPCSPAGTARPRAGRGAGGPRGAAAYPSAGPAPSLLPFPPSLPCSPLSLPPGSARLLSLKEAEPGPAQGGLSPPVPPGSRARAGRPRRVL